MVVWKKKEIFLCEFELYLFLLNKKKMKDVWYLKIKEGKLKWFIWCNIKFLYNMKEVFDLYFDVIFFFIVCIFYLCVLYMCNYMNFIRYIWLILKGFWVLLFLYVLNI